MRQPVVQMQGNRDNRETYRYCRYSNPWETQCYARYEKPLKNHPLDVAKKYVETYSSSYAVAQNLEERVQMNNEISLTLNTDKINKDEQIGRLTDLQCGSKDFGTLVKFWAKSRKLTVHASIVIWAMRVLLSLPFSPPPPFPPRQCWNMRAIDERILISETVKNPHCNGAMGKNGNCPNSFDLNCRMT